MTLHPVMLLLGLIQVVTCSWTRADIIPTVSHILPQALRCSLRQASTLGTFRLHHSLSASNLNHEVTASHLNIQTTSSVDIIICDSGLFHTTSIYPFRPRNIVYSCFAWNHINWMALH